MAHALLTAFHGYQRSLSGKFVGVITEHIWLYTPWFNIIMNMFYLFFLVASFLKPNKTDKFGFKERFNKSCFSFS